MSKKPLNVNFFAKNENVEPKTREQAERFSEGPSQSMGLSKPQIEREAPYKQSKKSPEEYDLDKLKALIQALPPEKKHISFGLIYLPTRCANVFAQEAIKTPADLLPLSNTDILRWRGFGRKSIKDLIKIFQDIDDMELKTRPATAAAERTDWIGQYLQDHPDQKSIFEQNKIVDEGSYVKARDSLEHDTIVQAENYRYDFLLAYIDRKNPFELLKICPAWLLDMEIIHFECDTRLRNMIVNNDIRVMSDFTKYNMKELWRLPGIGLKSITALAEYIHKAKTKGPPPSEENIKPSCKNLYKNLGGAFQASLDKITDHKHRFVIEQRLGVAGAVKALEEIAQQLGLTRERVRQIQKKVTQRITDGAFWDYHLKMCLESVMENRDSPVYMSKLSEVGPWLAGFEENEVLLKNIIVCFSRLKLKFLEHNGQTILGHIDNDEWEKLKSELLTSFQYNLDVQYTMEDIEMIIENRLAGFASKELAPLMFDEIYPDLNFSTNDLGMVLSSVGNSLTSRLEAILNDAPRSLHYSKIKDLYEERYGVNVSERNVHASLGHGDFLLFGRGIYGIQRHLALSETEQKDVMEQAERFLEQNADRQCHAHEILKTIKGHDIDKFILNIIVQKSKKASYLGKMVWVFGNDEANQRLPIKETIASILKQKGRPMRIEELEKEISKVRSVGANFSVQPNELFSRIDPATWGLLARDFVLPEKEWRKIKDQLFEYFSTHKKALYISELNQVAQKLCLDKRITTGHIVGVLSVDDRFRKWRSGLVGLADWDSPYSAKWPDQV